MTRFPITLATVVRLILASLVVGIVLSFLGITAGDIILRAREAMADVAANFGEWSGRIAGWVLLGSVIVVPIWLLVVAWRGVKARSVR